MTGRLLSIVTLFTILDRVCEDTGDRDGFTMTTMHVMIVEDDHSLARLYDKVLRNRGFRTLRVASVTDALAQLSIFDPDVISVDWFLGLGHTTAPLLDRLKAMPPKHRPQTVLISGEIDKAALSTYADVYDCYLPKPVLGLQLLQTVQRLAQKASQERVPIQEISIATVASNVVVYTWRGAVTTAVIRGAMKPALAKARRIIWDVRELSFSRLDLRELAPERHRHLPRLRHLYIVHHEQQRQEIQFLANAFSKQLQTNIHYLTDMTEALALTSQKQPQPPRSSMASNTES